MPSSISTTEQIADVGRRSSVACIPPRELMNKTRVLKVLGVSRERRNFEVRYIRDAIRGWLANPLEVDDWYTQAIMYLSRILGRYAGIFQG